MKNICAYCGKTGANSAEHIFTRKLFSDTIIVDFNGFTVPAHKECNQSFSYDEEFFREWVTSFAIGHSDNARQIFDGPITRKVRKHNRPALSMKIFSKMSLVDTPAGKKTQVSLDEEVHKRVRNVLYKFVRGLYYKHCGEPMSENTRFDIRWNMSPKEIINFKIRRGDQLGNGDVVSYGWNKAIGSDATIWHLLFYNLLSLSFAILARQSE